LSIIAALALCGCARDKDHAAGAGAQRAAVPPAAAAKAAAAPTEPASPISPSYEVAIASAQADRVHAINGCDDKQGAAHLACVREADRVYDHARDAAEKIRENGR
jgi:hypothetical protein